MTATPPSSSSASSKLYEFVDVGGLSDPTVVVGVSHSKQTRKFTVRVCEILPTVPFTKQVPRLLHIFEHSAPTLIGADHTGAGRGLTQMLLDPDYTADWAKRVRAVDITSGKKAALPSNKTWSFPKSEIISALQRNLPLLHIPRDLPNRETLQEQFLQFRSRISPSGNIVWGRNNRPDDCLIALGCALIICQKRGHHGPSTLTAPPNILLTQPDTNDLHQTGRPLDWGAQRQSGYATQIGSPDYRPFS